MSPIISPINYNVLDGTREQRRGRNWLTMGDNKRGEYKIRNGAGTRVDEENSNIGHLSIDRTYCDYHYRIHDSIMVVVKSLDFPYLFKRNGKQLQN